MKNQRGLVIFLLLSMFLVTLAKPKLYWPYSILTQMYGNNIYWFVTTPNGFVIQDIVDRKKKKLIASNTMLITKQETGIAINGVPIVQTGLLITPRAKLITINGISYQGIAHIQHKNGVIKLQVVGPRCAYWYKKQQIPSLMSVIESFCDLSQRSLTAIEKNLQETIAAINQQLLQIIDVRVLLSEYQGVKKERWHFYSSKGFIVHNQEKKKYYKQSKLNLAIEKGKIYISKAICPLPLSVTPLDGTILFNDSTYHGSFVISKDKDMIQCVNHLDVENYVFSVLRTESWPGWPVEINKALAIVSRSYVIAQAIRARKNKRSYDVKNTNVHQTYNGIHTSAIIKRAVDETRGMFLGFNNEPIVAMFDSCCGGIVPAGIADIDFEKAPYLARDYACTHCKNCKIYSWQVSYKYASFEQLLRREMNVIERFKDVKVIKKDKAGLVSEVLCKGAKKWITLSGKKIYSLLKEVKSFCFSIRKKGADIILKGRGFGHHLGLCQWGAREMVRDGWGYKRILQFYYPKTQLMCLV